MPAYGARRPLLAANGEVAGFEFRLGDAIARRLEARGDVLAQSAQAIALLAALRTTLASGRIALARMSAALLTRDAVAEQVPSGAMLLVDDWAGAPLEQREAITHLRRRRGLRLGVPARFDAGGNPDVNADEADFIVLGATAPQATDGITAQLQRWLLARPGSLVVATDVDTLDELEQLLHAGIAYVAGRVDATASSRGERPMAAAAQRICALLNEVVMDHDTTRIAAALRADVALSYRMLRTVNSPALGLSRTVDSIEQAVAILGRNELYRWLSVLLLAAADGRPTSRALQEIALARARLVEGLAREGSRDPPDALFTVGLLSLLDAMLQTSLAEALKPLHLSDPARDALLNGGGPWGHYLAIARALERHDGDAVNALAAEFGGIDAVLALADEAWRWAAAVTAAASR